MQTSNQNNLNDVSKVASIYIELGSEWDNNNDIRHKQKTNVPINYTISWQYNK